MATNTEKITHSCNPGARKKTVGVLHWVIALLIIMAYTLGLTMNHITGHKAFHVYDLHLQAGLLLLSMVAARIIWKYSISYKKIKVKLRMLKSIATEYLYILLYALILTVTILGIIFMQAKGRHLALFGVIDLPVLIKLKPKAFTYFIFQWHKWLSHTIAIVVCLHIINVLRYKLLSSSRR